MKHCVVCDDTATHRDEEGRDVCGDCHAPGPPVATGRHTHIVNDSTSKRILFKYCDDPTCHVTARVNAKANEPDAPLPFECITCKARTEETGRPWPWQLDEYTANRHRKASHLVRRASGGGCRVGCAELRLLQILSRLQEASSVVMPEAKSIIACVAEQSTNHASSMIVVNREAALLGRLLAYSTDTALRFQ